MHQKTSQTQCENFHAAFGTYLWLRHGASLLKKEGITGGFGLVLLPTA